MFEENLPKTVDGVGDCARAQMRVFEDGLPEIKCLVRYAQSTIASIETVDCIA